MYFPNFNYDEFVGAAIESALALEWPEVEGHRCGWRIDRSFSCPSSRDTRIASKSSFKRIPVRRRHALRFFKSRGDAVIFLDSDDLLDPSVAREIAWAWNPRVSKVQFQMRTIDATGRPLGTVLPQYHRVPTAHMFANGL